jgi:hypothetical protein
MRVLGFFDSLFGSVEDFRLLIGGVHSSKVIDLEGCGNFSYLTGT